MRAKQRKLALRRRSEAVENMTEAEQLMWSTIQTEVNRHLPEPYYFVRQANLFYGRIRPDFYCPKAKLALEVDGPIHENQLIEDNRRQRFLEINGIHVERIKNSAVYDFKHRMAFAAKLRFLVERVSKSQTCIVAGKEVNKQ
jgi:very-short-patch-repair endonuclease